MPVFAYNARDSQGIDHKGTIEASDPSQVARSLSQKGLVVLSIKEKVEQKESFINRFVNRVSFTDVVIATRQLATMIESGLVLSEALDILVDQQSNKNFQKVLSEISRDVKSGLDLAGSLQKHPDVFPPLYASLVKSGEESGKLDTVLTQMADSLEKDREFRSRVRGAMIYPATVIVMMIAVMIIMLVFVIPRLTSLYTQSSMELPLPTKILIAVSSFMVNFWWFGILGGVGAFYGLRKWIQTPSGRYRFDSLLLKIPIINKVVQSTSLTNFTRTFGLLTAAGVPLLEALEIVSQVISNSVYKRALQSTFKGVERGLNFSTQLEAIGVFPRLVPQMFKVGEETGKIDKVSYRLADYYESEADHLVKNMTVIIEPLILVVLGIGVAFIVLSIILPIYNLTTSFS